MLTNETQVFKMWFTEGGFSNPANIRYAESADGDNWTINSTVLLSDRARPNIYKENGNDWLYVTDITDTDNIELYRSSSEIIGSTDKVGDVLSSGASGTWDETLGNCDTWKESDGTYYMLYTGLQGTWEVGEATSSDGENWTKSSDNPVLSPDDIGTQHVGGIDMHPIDGEYYYWFHAGRSGNTPTDGGVLKTTDLRNWSTPSRGFPTFPRITAWEGRGQGEGQIADLCLLDDPELSKTHLWYSGADAQATGAFNIAHATTNLSPVEIYNY